MKEKTITDFDQVFEVILNLKDIDECRAFMQDLCTRNELKEMAQRFEVAKMLYEGCSYMYVARHTDASTATIARISKSLKYGCDGYKQVFARLSENETKENI